MFSTLANVEGASSALASEVFAVASADSINNVLFQYNAQYKICIHAKKKFTYWIPSNDFSIRLSSSMVTTLKIGIVYKVDLCASLSSFNQTSFENNILLFRVSYLSFIDEKSVIKFGIIR